MNIKNTNTSTETDCIFQQAKSFYQQIQYRQAEEKLNLLIEEQPGNVSYYYLMAKIQEKRGFHLKQIHLLNKAIELTPSASNLLIEMAFAQFSAFNFEQAYHFASLSAEHKNNSAETYSSISKLFNKLGQYDKAAQMLEAAVLLDHNDDKLFFHFFVKFIVLFNII